MSSNSDHSAFILGSCEVYAAPCEIGKDEIYSEKYFAGVSDGGCKLVYECMTHEIKDESGKLIGVLRSGEQLRISGKLAEISPSAVALMTGGVVSFDGTRADSVNILITSRVSDGTNLAVFAKCAVSKKGEMIFDCERGGGITFELISLGGSGSFRLVSL